MLSKQTYAYSPDGQITQWTQQVDSDTPLRYDLGYDKASQLKSAVLMNTSSNQVVKQNFYGYDAAGNRTSEQIDAGVKQGTYNIVNALTGVSGAGGPVRFQGTLSEPGTATVNGTPAKMTSGTSFEANPVLSTGTNSVSVGATDGSGNSRTNNYSVVVTSGSGRTLSYDEEGSMTSNGNGQTYEWNAAKQLVAINYTSGSITRTEFTYNGLGQRVKIVEKNGQTIVSTKQFIWYPGDAQPSEERDASDAVTRRFYAQGEQIAGANYYYTRDHLGSVRELTDATEAVRTRYDYDPYGRRTKVSGTLEATFGFTGHYQHIASGLTLAQYRAYDADLGRWISRDPLGEVGGLNLYGYVGNDPVNWIDSLGLFRFGSRPLSGLPWLGPLSSNILDDAFNTELSHEHGFFEDGSGENVGFGPNGRFSEDPCKKDYHYDDKHYDDDIMRQALKNVKDGDYSNKPWNKNNCQDWADRLRTEYNNIANPIPTRSTIMPMIPFIGP